MTTALSDALVEQFCCAAHISPAGFCRMMLVAGYVHWHVCNEWLSGVYNAVQGTCRVRLYLRHVG
jgi:hypothetical protein